MSNIFGLTCS